MLNQSDYSFVENGDMQIYPLFFIGDSSHSILTLFSTADIFALSVNIPNNKANSCSYLGQIL